MTTGKYRKDRLLRRALCALTVSVIVLCTASCSLDDFGRDESVTESMITSENVVTAEIEKSDPKGQPVVQTEIVTEPTDSTSSQIPTPDTELPASAEYYLSSASEDLIKCYKQFQAGLKSHTEEIDITQGVIHKDDFQSFMSLMMATTSDMPQLDSQYKVILDDDEYVKQVVVSYVKSAEQAESELMQLRSEIESICQQTEGMSDYEKLKFFHDKIILKCTYNDEGENAYTAYGCLIDGRAVCEGYAKAMLMLCERAGIMALPIIGSSNASGESIPHAWNKVCIDGQWYNIDVTWDDPISSSGDDYLRYDYFNITDDVCSIDHDFEQSQYMTYPAATAVDENYFVKSNLFIYDSSQAFDVIFDAVLYSADNSDRYVRIKCADSEVYNYVNQQFFGSDDGQGEIFNVLRLAEEQSGYKIVSTAYSVMQNEPACTITIVLNLV